jgi:hypothetical protein
MCAEPVRNVRGGPGGSANLLSLPRWVLALLLVGVVIVAGRYILGGRRGPALDDPPKPVERAKGDAPGDRPARALVISASRLLREFQSDPGADQKYQGKYLELFGTVERSGKDREDTPFVILNAGDEGAALKIECFFEAADEEDGARIAKLPKGEMVSVRGRYRGRISHLQIRDCVLVK